MKIRGREGAILNGATAMLAQILPRNGNTGGMGLDSLLVLALGIKQAQLTAVRVMGIKNQGREDRIPSYGEVWSNTNDIFRVGQSPKLIPTNNSTTGIAFIGNS